MQILGNDPGTASFGYTVLDATKRDFKILEIGMIESTIRNLTEERAYKKPTKAEKAKAEKQGIRLTKNNMPFFVPLTEGFPIYYNCVNQLIEDYKLSWYVAERFQTRGIGGPTIEMVSMMNGITATLCHSNNIKFRYVVASQWKNEINKIGDLEAIYDYAKQFGLTPHECDSTGIALYQLHKLDYLPLQISLQKWRQSITKYMNKKE